MKLKYYLLALPFLVVAEFYAYSQITYLLRQPSDGAVLAGVIGICLLISINLFFVRSILSKIKPK
jgi:hypothetical protein